MQSRLRNGSLLFVASLLWISPMFAAAQKPQQPTAKKPATHYRFTGVASWYGKQHQGRKMANGQKFDRGKMTAACWFLPLGTVVQVVNLKNGKSVQVTIADRGPNTRLHRLLDLSEAAAVQLDFIDAGVTPVFLSPVVKAVPESAKLNGRLVDQYLQKPAPQEMAMNLPLQ
jgi:rare lipoprotein A